MNDKDTIYRQDAIDIIHKVIIDFFDLCDDDEESPMTYKDEKLLEVNKAIYTQIKSLPSAQPEQRWIPVTERLPDVGRCVLATTSWASVEKAVYFGEHWEIDGLDYKIRAVVAWMPLPEPYQKEGEAE